MKVHRVKRVDFCTDPVAKRNPSGKARGALCVAHRVLLATGVCFLFACIGFLAFFLSQSDIVSSGSSLLGVARKKCRRDKDCLTRLRSDFDSLSWGQCLLPPNETSRCVDRYCVDPPPVAVNTPDPCDDSAWCTVHDQCVPGEGICRGVTRSCHDEDFCSLETCSEDLRSCVSMDVDDAPETCENTCANDDDCRHEFYCAHGRCANFQARNSSLFFAAYEIQPCPDAADAYAMIQHYIVYEQGYSLDLREGHVNEATRYKALRSSDGVKFPSVSDGAIPLVSASGVQTRIIPKTATTPGYSEITLSLKTECQSFPDDSTCLTKWMKRKYDFELELQDCVLHENDPLGSQFGSRLGDCLPVKIQRGFTMNLDLVDCPAFPQFSNVSPLLSLRFQYGGNQKEPVSVIAKGDWVQAVVEMNAAQQQLFPILSDQSPFLTSAVVCGVNPFHRLAGCALNTQAQNCPVRGCRGWSGVDSDDSPLLWYRDYMQNAERLSAAITDGVKFCRGVGYQTLGCVPDKCDWGTNTKQPVFGSADGFMFPAVAAVGETVVADVQFRMEYCGSSGGASGEAGRRLDRRLAKFPDRAVAVFKVQQGISDSEEIHG